MGNREWGNDYRRERERAREWKNDSLVCFPIPFPLLLLPYSLFPIPFP
jgi:hypothetical protein